MRTLTDFNRRHAGLMGITVLVLVVAVGQSFTSIPMMFASPSYYGQFTDSGQLNKNDRVRISGVNVGTVQALDIDGDHVVIKFSIGSNTIGTESRLAIKTDTLLGKRCSRSSRGEPGSCRPGGCCHWAKAPPRISSTTRTSTSSRPPPAGTSAPSRGR